MRIPFLNGPEEKDKKEAEKQLKDRKEKAREAAKYLEKEMLALQKALRNGSNSGSD